VKLRKYRTLPLAIFAEEFRGTVPNPGPYTAGVKTSPSHLRRFACTQDNCADAPPGFAAANNFKNSISRPAYRGDGKYDVTVTVEARKFKADAKGNETEVPVEDWIGIGAFAKPEKNRKYGKTLYRERVHMSQTTSSYSFVTDEVPDQAGIDPFLLLVDRIPDDNTKQVTVAGSSGK
jgi:hypothetical protein